MKLIVGKIEKISGEVILPSSKSQTIRALFLATLAKGESVLKNPLICDDTKIATQVCKDLGAKIQRQENGDLKVLSSGVPFGIDKTELNTGSSGISTRFVLPLLGLRKNSEEEIILDCSAQMRQRPITSLILALQNLGMTIKSLNNSNICPLSISGILRGGQAKVSGLTSQFVSALLLSLPLAEQDSMMVVEDLRERPYVEMTVRWLKDLGIKFEYEQKDSRDIFKISGRQSYHAFIKQIPADFSSASYLIAGGVLFGGQVKLQGIDMNDAQGDKRLIDLLQEMGADIKIKGSELIITGGKKLRGIKIDASEIPDIVPTLAVIATQAEGETEIYNVVQARNKETDRINSMATGLGAMGAYVREREDGLVIRKSDLTGAEVEGYDDHRTVMALSLAGMLAEGETVISTAEAVNKTFPNYVEVMNSIGANLKLIK